MARPLTVTRRLTVGFDARCLGGPYPGVGRYAHELLEALAAQGSVDLRVLVPARSDDRFDLTPLRKAGVTLEPTALPMRGIAEQVRLPALVRRLAPEVWHAPYLVTAYRQPRPTVINLYDAIAVRDRRFLPSRPKRLAYRLATMLAARTARVVVVPSEAARDEIITFLRLPARRLEVVPAGVGTRFRPATPEAVEVVRRAHRLPRRYVLHVGTDRPHKNLARLRAAWSRLPTYLMAEHEPEAPVLALAGYRPPGPKAADPPGVRTLGAIDEASLPALYSGATAVVQPSLAEGFGLPVLEAMACGAPVVCARAGALPEVAGDAARYVDPTDTDDIADVLVDVITNADERQRLATAGRRHATRWTWTRSAETMVTIYRRLATT